MSGIDLTRGPYFYDKQKNICIFESTKIISKDIFPFLFFFLLFLTSGPISLKMVPLCRLYIGSCFGFSRGSFFFLFLINRIFYHLHNNDKHFKIHLKYFSILLNSIIYILTVAANKEIIKFI